MPPWSIVNLLIVLAVHTQVGLAQIVAPTQNMSTDVANGDPLLDALSPENSAGKGAGGENGLQVAKCLQANERSEELLQDGSFAQFPFNISQTALVVAWTPAERKAFADNKTVPDRLQSKWTAVNPWISPNFPTNTSKGAVNRCFGSTGPDYDAYFQSNRIPPSDDSPRNVTFSIVQRLDVSKFSLAIDRGNQRVVQVIKPVTDFPYSAELAFFGDKGSQLGGSPQGDPAKLFTAVGSEVPAVRNAAALPRGTRSVEFRLSVDMAIITSEQKDAVCFNSFSTVIGSFTPIPFTELEVLGLFFVTLIICVLNCLILPWLLAFRRKNLMLQILPFNLVYPYTTKETWVLGCLFVSMLSWAQAALSNYQKIVPLKGFLILLYPVILLGFLLVLSLFFFADFVALAQVQRFKARRAAIIGSWSMLFKTVLQFWTVLLDMTGFFREQFFNENPNEVGLLLIKTMQNLPPLIAAFAVFVWFVRKAMFREEGGMLVDQTAEYPNFPPKERFEKDFAYVRRLLASNETMKRHNDLQTTHQIFSNKKVPSDSIRDKSFIQRGRQRLYEIFIKPYLKMDVRFRVLMICTCYIVWFVIVKYGLVVYGARRTAGCYSAFFILSLEMTTQGGKFFPARDGDEAYTQLTNQELLSFGIVMMRLLEAASTIAIIGTVITMLYNICATAKDVRRRQTNYARGIYSEHFTKKDSRKATVFPLSVITGKIIAFSFLGALVFFVFSFIFLLLIFWISGILAFSPLARQWLARNQWVYLPLVAWATNRIYDDIHKQLVTMFFTVDKLRFKYRTGFHLWEFIVMFANAATSLNSFVYRLFIATASFAFHVGRIDIQLVHGFFVPFVPWETYHGYVYAAYVYRNHTANAFVALLLHRNEGKPVKVVTDRKSEWDEWSIAEYRMQRRQRIMRKLWVAYYIHRNPSLRYYRKAYVAEILEKRGSYMEDYEARPYPSPQYRHP